MKIDQVTIDILVFDKPVRKYSDNSGRTFIEARLGEEYSIKIKNNSSERILVIPSVDSLNVINGMPASTEGAGYIICGYSSFEIKGFRTSNESVNSFKFSSKEASYAVKSEENEGDTSNCGIIGIAIFSEKFRDIEKELNEYLQNPSPYPPYKPYKADPWPNPKYYNHPYDVTREGSTYRCSTEPSKGILRSAAFDAGTAFSSKELADRVEDGKFDKNVLEGTLEVFYATRKGLESMGIKLAKEPEINFPSAFPEKKFCKPPKK